MIEKEQYNKEYVEGVVFGIFITSILFIVSFIIYKNCYTEKSPSQDFSDLEVLCQVYKNSKGGMINNMYYCGDFIIEHKENAYYELRNLLRLEAKVK